MMTPDCLDVLEAFHEAKALGLHSSICPLPASFTSELMGLLARKTKLGNRHQSKRIKDPFSRMLPPYIHNAFQIWTHATQEKMASPLDYNTHDLHYWSSDPRDILFGAQHNSLSSKYSGISICHPIYDGKAMPLALQHAIYSAILNTEATATFMFLPASDKLTYDNPQSWPSQGIALPQHTWDLQSTVVWNTAARLYLNNQNPTWLRGLASGIPEAKWYVESVRKDPIRNARHNVVPGIGKCEKLPLNKKQIAKAPNKPATDITAPIPYDSCQVQDGKTVLGAGMYHFTSDSKIVEPNGAGITNTIGRAELAAVAAALTHRHTQVATDSLSSLHQLRQQILYPEKHRHHAQGDVLKKASLKNNNLTDTRVPSAGPGGNPSYNIA
eukprot:1161269-Pelagomonas_calceolata.AAC.11